MAQYDHNAIMRAYPNQISSIIDGVGVTNKDGVMFEPDATLVANARAELDKLSYRSDRKYAFEMWGDQLDQLYHDIESGKFGEAAKSGDWYVGITSIKNTYPKPS
tara:strand:+ start:188 stop:502 length:315 start_codon:yes stop_codon:yes gene_type:complete